MTDPASGADLVPSGRANRRRILQLAGICAAGLLYVAGGLVYRQAIQHQAIEDQHERQIRHAILIPGSRGRIFDRNGFELVDNRVRWSVTVDLGKLRPQIIREQRRLLAQERAAWRAPGAYRPDYDKLRDQARVNVIQLQLDKVNRALSTPRAQADFRVSPAALARHLRERRASPFPAIEDLADGERRPGERLARFMEQLPDDGILALRSEVVRSYPHGSLACHVLGHVRPSESNDPEAERDLRARLSAQHNLGASSFSVRPSARGVKGVESAFNRELGGTHGYLIIERNIAGEQRKVLASREPRQGAHVTLSIDLDIQRAAERALGPPADPNRPFLPGSAAMIDVATGEVLALASLPGFDPNKMTGRISQEDYDEVDAAGGWFNRATQGLYPPGSTFKIVTAIAGVRSGAVRHDEILDCGPFLMVGNRAFPEHTPEGYGPTDMEKMLIISCNVWNYIVGLRTGIDRLAAEARRLGLADPLLVSAFDGRPEYAETARGMIIPTPEYKRRRHAGEWSPGDTANTSIGQGYLLTTPLHMAAMMASIAQGRTRTNLTLIHDPGRELVHPGAEPLGLTAAQRRALLDGLTRCVEEGTGGPMRIPGLSVAAKTGTSEYFNEGRKAHLAWAVGFAPAENPRVAFAVCIEGEDMSSWGGATAGPVAREMLLAWARRAMPAVVPAEPAR